MSSPNNKSAANGEGGVPNDEKPRLTEEEKKQNHIASGMKVYSVFLILIYIHVSFLNTLYLMRTHTEQKRRQAIREGFDRLTELVPGLEGQGRSEGLVLKRTVDYMREQLSERQAIIDRIEQAGGDVDEKHKRAIYQQANNPGRTRG
ncbi:BHLH domain-containing protein [Fusarium sp. LHS14.1]|nr:BHLH domain-containing protein [Fusarium sp. LHS14.1]